MLSILDSRRGGRVVECTGLAIASGEVPPEAEKTENYVFCLHYTK